MLHETTKKFMEGFRYDAHPMAMFVSTVAALSSVYPEARHVHDPAKSRCIRSSASSARCPLIAAYTYRHSLGFPYVYPDNDLSYAENFMNMLWKMVEPKYAANPVMARALDILFILHADHEQNCSANAMRAVGSSHADPYLADRIGGRRAFRPAARRRQRRSAPHARRDRHQGRTFPPTSRASRTAKAS